MIVDTISSHTYGVQFATLEAFFFLTLEASATNTLSRKNINFSDCNPKNIYNFRIIFRKIKFYIMQCLMLGRMRYTFISHIPRHTSNVTRHPIVFAIFSMFKLRAEASMMSL